MTEYRCHTFQGVHIPGPVYPAGYPGEGYRYAIAIPGDLLAFAGGPDGLDPADSPELAGDPPAPSGDPAPAAG